MSLLAKPMRGKCDSQFWTKAKTMQLIELFESNSDLWNVESTMYCKRNHKVKLLYNIAETLGTSVQDVCGKLHNLRCQFNATVRKVKSMSDSDKSYEPRWEFFKSLKFLLRNGNHNIGKYSSSSSKMINSPMTTTDNQLLDEDLCDQKMVIINSAATDATDEIVVPTNSYSSSSLTEIPTTTSTYTTPGIEECADNSLQSVIDKAKDALDDICGKRKYNDDVDAFGELIKSELQAVNNRNDRQAIRYKILKVIMEHGLTTGTTATTTTTTPVTTTKKNVNKEWETRIEMKKEVEDDYEEPSINGQTLKRPLHPHIQHTKTSKKLKTNANDDNFDELPRCVRSYADALRLLKPLEDFALLEENYRAINLITQIETLFLISPQSNDDD